MRVHDSHTQTLARECAKLSILYTHTCTADLLVCRFADRTGPDGHNVAEGLLASQLVVACGQSGATYHAITHARDARTNNTKRILVHTAEQNTHTHEHKNMHWRHTNKNYLLCGWLAACPRTNNMHANTHTHVRTSQRWCLILLSTHKHTLTYTNKHTLEWRAVH